MTKSKSLSSSSQCRDCRDDHAGNSTNKARAPHNRANNNAPAIAPALAMERSGLVRRVRTRDTADANGGNGGTGGDDNDNVARDQDEQELDDNDSKETRLTLMEEVLLLGLKDKEVRYARLTQTHA